MVQVDAGAELGLEPRYRVLVARAQHLERDLVAQVAVEGAIDDPHPTLTDRRDVGVASAARKRRRGSGEVQRLGRQRRDAGSLPQRAVESAGTRSAATP
jgi:hypothetical protein